MFTGPAFSNMHVLQGLRAEMVRLMIISHIQLCIGRVCGLKAKGQPGRGLKAKDPAKQQPGGPCGGSGSTGSDGRRARAAITAIRGNGTSCR